MGSVGRFKGVAHRACPRGQSGKIGRGKPETGKVSRSPKA